jgi:Zn finger protein HypA/HybF involved in hydrogenase expression
MTEIVAFNRTLDQELLSLMRGVSLECLVCGEFVLHTGEAIICPECGARFEAAAESGLQLSMQAG